MVRNVFEKLKQQGGHLSQQETIFHNLRLFKKASSKEKFLKLIKKKFSQTYQRGLKVNVTWTSTSEA